MRVVIAGAGAVGTFLAEDLAGNGHEVLVLEKSPAAIARVLATPGVQLVAADACEVDVLQAAGLSEADVVVAVTGDDEDNLVIALLAKQEFAVPRVIARVNHPKNHWLFNESWGVDIAVSTPHLLSALVEEAVSVGSIVQLLQLEGGRAQLLEITLADEPRAARTTIDGLGLPHGAVVVAIVRDRGIIVPRADTALSVGDEVVLLVTGEAEKGVRELFLAVTGSQGTGPPETGSQETGSQAEPDDPAHSSTRGAAFFDLDKTVIARAAVGAFFGPLYRGGLLTKRSILRAFFAQIIYLHLGATKRRETKVREITLRLAAGWSRPAVMAIVDETLERIVEPIIYAEALELIEAHRAAGDLVVLVSASPEEIVIPLADHLGVDEVIASRAAVDSNDRYTGEMSFYAYGPYKAVAITALAERSGIDLRRSSAYSDSYTDVPMLEAVGHPIVVNPDRVLAKIALDRHWEVRNFVEPVRVRDRGHVASTRPGVAVSAGAFVLGAFALTVGWLVTRRRTRVRTRLFLSPERRTPERG